MAMEGILVNGVTEILKPLISLISQQITLAWGVKDDLRKLKDTLESIQALISDAEKKQVDDAPVRLWLRRLKDVIYDVDDVMDEFYYETMRPRKNKVRALVSSSNPLVFKFKMARKIRVINETLDEIHKNSEMYMLRNTSTVPDGQSMEKRNRLTSSVVDDSILLGRQGSKSEIMKLLIDKSSPSSLPGSGISSDLQNVSTLSIVGMGGLGKTTVAQMVYKDESVVKNFELRAWVCVSDVFDIYKILRDIIESVTGRKYEDPSNVDVLAKQVKENLIDKKYLLVLDDLWNEDDSNWNKLKSYLIYGGMGSKILITTRCQKVASTVGGPIHNLAKLSDDVCWSIIEKKVLSRGGAVLTKKMTTIGTEIARKCDGLPLAANSLGSLMCSRRDESYWQSVVNNINLMRGTSEHTRIISILKLSFDNLSSPLKQCFSYCCIFPKDWEINREMLIQLWMAEGFLSPSSRGDNNISTEDIGNEYFEYLVWSSFFQDVQKDENSIGITTCKMHDLVHDLATSVLDSNEFRIAKVGDRHAEVSEVRRLQLLFDEGQSLGSSNVLPDLMKLRTIIALRPKSFKHVNSFFRHRRLRVLCSLGGWRECSLPCGIGGTSSISKLKHLRYLDLSHIDSFPAASLYHCYSLQTLVLHGCAKVPSWLLSSIVGSLKNLRHLDISSSGIQFIPENIGSFKHLASFDISCTSISKLPDSITCISSLRALKFDNCWNLDALPRELGALTGLRRLNLDGTSVEVLPESCISNLSNLEIVKLGGRCQLPKEIMNWPKLRIFTPFKSYDVMPRGLEMLTCLERLEDYKVIKENEGCGGSNNSGIEELAGLNSLQVLGIRNPENVRGGKEGAERAKLKDKQHLQELHLYWGGNDGEEEEMRNSRMLKDCPVLEGLQPHPNLQKLWLGGFSGVKLPKWMGSSYCLQNLAELHIKDLDNCEKLPALGMLPFLRFIIIIRMKSIKSLGEEFYYQQEEEQSTVTKRSSFFPTVDEMYLEFSNLEEWVAPPPLSSCFPSLVLLHVLYPQTLSSIPLASFTSLNELRLFRTTDDAMNSLFTRGGGIGCLTSLTILKIWYSPDVIYLPPLGVLLRHNTTRLKELNVWYCPNFKGFRDDDLNNNNHINSLHHLNLRDCPVLTSLPDLRLWTSLRKLDLSGCHELNKESIVNDLKTSLTFLDELNVDF